MNRQVVLACLMGLALGAGCGQKVVTTPRAEEKPQKVAEVPRETVHLDEALARLRTIQLWLGAKELTVELALSPVEIATGMMFRRELPENEGMLFVFAYPHQTAFYMKNTVVPLSVAYIDADGIILEIRELQPLNETPQPAASDQIQYALEVNQGWFERNQIGPGTVVRTERGTLAETFLGGEEP